MHRQSYIGQPPLSSGGGNAPAIVWSMTSPGSGYLDLGSNFLTELQLKQQRGKILPKVPTCTYGLGVAMGVGGSGMASANGARQFFAAGGGGMFQIAATANSASYFYIGWYNVHNGGYWMNPTVNSMGANEQPVGISWANNRLVVNTTVGLWTIVPTLGTGNWWGFQMNNQITQTKVASVVAGGSFQYNQVRYINGVYVLYANGYFSAGGTQYPVKYSTDLITWTNCNMPTLNTDNAGSPGGNTISVIIPDPYNNRLVGISGFGDIVTTTDGINWTMTFNRLAVSGPGGSIQFSDACITETGKLYVVSIPSGGVGAPIYAPNVASPWVGAVITPPAGKTFGDKVRGCAYTAGVLALSFGAQSNNQASFVWSNDDGLTWNYATGFSGTDGTRSPSWAGNGESFVLATEGTFQQLIVTSASQWLQLSNGQVYWTNSEIAMQEMRYMNLYGGLPLSAATLLHPWIKLS